MGHLLTQVVFLLLTRCSEEILEDSDAAEFFAGTKSVTHGLEGLGFKVLPYDLTYDAAMDFNSAAGLLQCWALDRLDVRAGWSGQPSGQNTFAEAKSVSRALAASQSNPTIPPPT